MAFAFVERSGERRHAAELHRLEAECLRRTEPDRARSALDQALALARAQGARLWELRAATSLADLLASTGDREGARGVLADLEDVAAAFRSLPDARRLHAVQAAL